MDDLNEYKRIRKTWNPPENAKEKIKDLLGKDKGFFYSARDISKKVGLPAGGTQVKTRVLLLDMILEDGIPIVSGSKGFAWAENPYQVKKYVKELEGRILGIQTRIKALKKIVGHEEKYDLGKYGQGLNTHNCGDCGIEIRIPNHGLCKFCEAVEKNKRG